MNNIINSNQRRGLEFQGSRKNNALSNFIDSNGEEGIILFNSSSITISGNTISSNYLEAIVIEEDSYFNKIYHNNIIDDKIYDKSLNSWWYNQSLKEGNYWSDYDGVDDGSGTGKHAIAGDGIGDTNIPYLEKCYDLYPLMSRDGWLTASIMPHYLDFRRVYQKTWVNQTFNITNYANSILNVTTIKSDFAINITGITLPAEIPKGESQRFNITLNTENLEGFVLKNIEIITNDAGNRHKNISIFGFIDVHSPKVEIMGIKFLPRIIKGQINLFNVTLINTGDFQEKNVSIEFKEGDNCLGNTTITNIESKESKSAIFRWDTTDVEAKRYDIVIEVKLNDNQLTLDRRQVSVMVDIPSAPQTLIITNRERLAEYWGVERAEKLENKLIKLSYHASVGGIPVYVEEDEAVAEAYELWDSNLQDPQLANNVAKQIRRLIDDKLEEYTGITYIVIVGDDRIIPFYRIPDNTDKQFGIWFPTEDDYEDYGGIFKQDSTIGSALSNNMLLTDNFYATDKPIECRTADVKIPELFIQNIPVSRLVETPEQIAAVIEAFYRKEYVSPEAIFVTGYDFMWDTASHCSSTLEKKLKTKPETIVGRDIGELPPDYFKNVKESLLNTSNDVILIFQFAEHDRFIIPKSRGAELITSLDISTASADLNSSIVYTMGCHAGLNVPPNSSTNDFDLVEAFAQKGVVAYVAPTGFAIGSFWVRAAHELLLSYFTTYLCEGKDVGTALTLAKQEYWATNYDFSYIDEKVLATTTLYGLPMAKLTIPRNRPSHNLSVLTIKSNLKEKPDTLIIRPRHVLNRTSDGDYYISPGEEFLSVLNMPILPKEIRIFHPGRQKVLRGVVLNSSKYHIDETFIPLIEGFQISDQAQSPSFFGRIENWSPARIFKLNSISYPGPHAESRQYLVIITAQYKGPVGPPIREKLFEISDREVVTDLNNDLNNGTISDKLRNIFVAKDYPLSENSTLIKRGDNEWTITDKDKKIIYVIEKLAGELFISEEESGIERIYDELSFDLYYDFPDVEAEPSSIENVSHNWTNKTITMTVDDSSGIRRVQVTYTDINSSWGEWRSEDCRHEEGDVWTCSIPTEEEIEFFVQTVDIYGNVAVDDNEGHYYPEKEENLPG